MIIYFVASTTVQADTIIRAGADGVLFSVPKLDSSGQIKKDIKNILELKQIKYFLDCGAFSVATGVGGLDLNSYCDFVRRHGHYFETVAALDVINDAEASYSNYKYMINNGISHKNLVLTWHGSESLEYIDRLVRLSDYIALGGFGRWSAFTAIDKISLVRKAIDRVKSIDKNTRIHLFGIQDLKVIKFFCKDITSADASSWLQGEKYANLLTVSQIPNSANYHKRLSNHYMHANYYNLFQYVRAYKMLNEYAEQQQQNQIPYRIQVTKT